jgi:DNA ligase D-like protein (predicted 3'-phosphoesterase)
MSLKEYEKKRNLKKSGEPEGVKGKIEKNRRLFLFVIHKHAATHLHWDLRLEMNGVLKSWAVPKQPPKTKGIKRLAIQVENHPLEYAKFHGTIPEGHYGAGKVEIWDKGKYELLEKNPKSMKIKLHGKKLKGDYVLVKAPFGNKPDKSWLFFKA